MILNKKCFIISEGFSILYSTRKEKGPLRKDKRGYRLKPKHFRSFADSELKVTSSNAKI